MSCFQKKAVLQLRAGKENVSGAMPTSKFAIPRFIISIAHHVMQHVIRIGVAKTGPSEQPAVVLPSWLLGRERNYRYLKHPPSQTAVSQDPRLFSVWEQFFFIFSRLCDTVNVHNKMRGRRSDWFDSEMYVQVDLIVLIPKCMYKYCLSKIWFSNELNSMYHW